ncbi:hypothetical protein [Diaphorobacter nitroreducens]|nr:hypothetical protein [Diaphorobacter nitroreducens]
MDSVTAQVIRINALWLITEPLDMRAGTDTALADWSRSPVLQIRTSLI